MAMTYLTDADLRYMYEPYDEVAMPGDYEQHCNDELLLLQAQLGWTGIRTHPSGYLSLGHLEFEALAWAPWHSCFVDVCPHVGYIITDCGNLISGHILDWDELQWLANIYRSRLLVVLVYGINILAMTSLVWWVFECTRPPSPYLSHEETMMKQWCAILPMLPSVVLCLASAGIQYHMFNAFRWLCRRSSRARRWRDEAGRWLGQH
jgi:hypothetical protein